MNTTRKRIVFIVGSYYPFPSAVGVCAEKIISKLSENHDVNVIYIKNNFLDNESNCSKQYNIHPVFTSYAKWKSKLDSINNLTPKIKSFLHIALKLKKLLSVLLNKATLDRDLLALYIRALEDLNKIKKIDVLIPCCFPFEAVVSSLKFKSNKNDGVLVIPYLFDNFAKSASLHRHNLIRTLKFKENQKLEMNMLKNSDGILAMHPLKSYFESEFLGQDMLVKINYVEHPLLERPKIDDASFNNGKLTLNYSGGLFENVREPDYMLDLIKTVNQMVDIRFDVFSFGSASYKVHDYCKINKFVKYHGQVPRDVIFNAYSKADVLVNLGEIEGKQISSKIFEYMSMGKPILHIEFTSTCVVSHILANYPLALIVNVKEELDVASLRFFEFLKNNAKKRIDFDFIQEIYKDATPAFTVRELEKLILKESDLK